MAVKKVSPVRKAFQRLRMQTSKEGGGFSNKPSHKQTAEIIRGWRKKHGAGAVRKAFTKFGKASVPHPLYTYLPK